MRRGYEINWSNRRVSPEHADYVLAALGMLHMSEKCVLPEELSGDYEDEVGAPCVDVLYCLQ